MQLPNLLDAMCCWTVGAAEEIPLIWLFIIYTECPILLFVLFVFSLWMMGMGSIPVPNAAISSPKVVIFHS